MFVIIRTIFWALLLAVLLSMRRLFLAFIWLDVGRGAGEWVVAQSPNYVVALSLLVSVM